MRTSQTIQIGDIVNLHDNGVDYDSHKGRVEAVQGDAAIITGLATNQPYEVPLPLERLRLVLRPGALKVGGTAVWAAAAGFPPLEIVKKSQDQKLVWCMDLAKAVPIEQ